MFGPNGRRNVFIGGYEDGTRYEYEDVGLEPDWDLTYEKEDAKLTQEQRDYIDNMYPNADEPTHEKIPNKYIEQYEFHPEDIKNPRHNNDDNIYIKAREDYSFTFEDFMEGKIDIEVEDYPEGYVDEDGNVHEIDDGLGFIVDNVEKLKKKRDEYQKEKKKKESEQKNMEKELSFSEQLALEAQKLKEQGDDDIVMIGENNEEIHSTPIVIDGTANATDEIAKQIMEEAPEGLSFTEKLAWEAKRAAMMDLEDDDDDEEDIVMDAGVDPEEKDETVQGKIARGEKVKPCLAEIRKTMNFTKGMIDRFVDTYAEVYVHDYGDEYHLTEEERAKKFRCYEAQELIRQNRKVYTNLPDYIEAMRRVIKAIEIIAANDPRVTNIEKFKKKVLGQKIKVTGINFPKYRGKDKKSINGEFISDWILDPEKDIDELMDYYKKKNVVISLEDEENPQAAFERIAGKGVMEYLNSHPVTDDDRWAYAVPIKPKSKLDKALEKSPIMKSIKKEMIHAAKRKESLDVYGTYYTTKDEFDAVTKHDEELGYTTKATMPKLNGGDIRNKKVYREYMEALEAWKRENTFVKVKGKNMSLDDYNHMRFKEIAEQHGWNVALLMKNEADTMDADEKKYYTRAKKISARYSKFIVVKGNEKARRQTKLKVITDENRKRADVLEYVISSVDEENGYKIPKKYRYRGVESLVKAVAREDKALGRTDSKYIKMAKGYSKKIKEFDPVKFLDEKKDKKKGKGNEKTKKNKNGVNVKKSKKTKTTEDIKNDFINALVPPEYQSWDEYEKAMSSVTFKTYDMKVKERQKENEKKKLKKKLKGLPKKAKEQKLAAMGLTLADLE